VTRSPFFRGMLSGSLPLWIWAGQFASSYVWVVVACHAGWEALVPGPLIVGSALAAIAIAWLLVRARMRAGLLGTVRLIGALVALIGVVWGVVPVFLLPACRIS
jgi:hypothetical protein